ALLTRTTQTYTSFTGQNGHTYGFVSAATDNVGNHEATPPSADATTRIDDAAPTSRVAALPAVSLAATFTVSWAGQDNAGGSGIAFYDVYVSDNAGPFALWKSATEATSAAYPGAFGHAYSIFSVATD